jgi:hypothetical protein
LLEGVQVFVPNFEVREIGGVFLSFGSRTEVWYVVQSTASKAPVKRQQEDFQWLSDTLVRLFPLQAVLLPTPRYRSLSPSPNNRKTTTKSEGKNSKNTYRSWLHVPSYESPTCFSIS